VDPSVPDHHSFVVRVWLEDSPTEAGRTVWRGSIQHVPDGRRRHVRQLGEVVAFIWPYLEEMGIRPAWSWQLWRWYMDRLSSVR
jgi:hypothetical protein